MASTLTVWVAASAANLSATMTSRHQTTNLGVDRVRDALVRRASGSSNAQLTS